MQRMKELGVRAVKSKIITSKDKLFGVLGDSLKQGDLVNGDVLVITSKVVAVTEGRIARVTGEKEFNELVRREADEVIGGKKVTLTLKNGIFTPWAGIDRSNTKKGTVVLWPKNPAKTAREIHAWLKKTYGLRKVGVLIVDSFCVPLRKGVTGIALGHAGFAGVNDKRGTKDLYGNSLKVTREAVADSLATMANLVTGQGNEQTPFAIIRNAPVKFTDKRITPRDLMIKAKECLYAPLYRSIKNKKVKF